METTLSKETMGVSDILDMFPGVETDNVLTKPANNILSNDNDMSFLDKPANVILETTETEEAKLEREKKEKEGTSAAAAKPEVSLSEAEKILDSIGKEDNEGLEGGEGTGNENGDKKTGRDGITSYLKGKIESGDFSAFDDWDEKKETLDAYLAKQPVKTLHSMLDANWEAKEKDILDRTPKEFFESLPVELQYAAKYAMDGGKDMKNFFLALAQVEQTKALDITTEEGQLNTARNYLQATGFGRGKAEVIEKQVQEWKEDGKLPAKAAEFKPDLDEMQKEQVEYKMQQQEEWDKQQRLAAQAYVNNVAKSLKASDINGIKLDRKTQESLYNGLTTLSYSNSAGKPTNLLGHLLDKIQYVEPNFPLLAEVTYLLSNPEAYRNSIKQIGKNEGIVDTVKRLKTEVQLNGNAVASGDDIDDEEKPKVRKLTKPRNVFERS